MRALCAATFEFEIVATKFMARLGCISCQMVEHRMMLEYYFEAASTFIIIIFRFCRLLHRCKRKVSELSRFISCRASLRGIQELHEELDHFTVLQNLIQTDAEWKKQWTKDEVVCRRRLYENLRKDENLLRGLDDDRGKHNAVTLLDHEIRQTMDPEAEQHLQRVAGRLRRTCQFDIPTRPLWFISQEDVEFNKWSQIENSNGDTEYDGKWLETAVTIASTSLEVAKFEEATSRWYQLNHPHVRKLFGACHIASPPFLVYEHGTWLLEKLAVPGQQQLEWKYLHQAALGLQYLHERGIVHGNLRCHNIVIGSDGNAKVPGFGEHHIDDLKCDNVLIGMDGTAFRRP